MEDELKRDELFREDILKATNVISPKVSYLGLISGGLTAVNHICAHRSKISAEDESVKSNDEDSKIVDDPTIQKN